MVGRNLFSEIPLQLVHLLMRICEVLKATRSGPKIPAVGPFGGGFLFGLDKFGHLMADMPYLPNFRSLDPPHGLEEATVVH